MKKFDEKMKKVVKLQQIKFVKLVCIIPKKLLEKTVKIWTRNWTHLNIFFFLFLVCMNTFLVFPLLWKISPMALHSSHIIKFPSSHLTAKLSQYKICFTREEMKIRKIDSNPIDQCRDEAWNSHQLMTLENDINLCWNVWLLFRKRRYIISYMNNCSIKSEIDSCSVVFFSPYLSFVRLIEYSRLTLNIAAVLAVKERTSDE